MLEIDFLKKYYKGNGIKVALIDDGTTNKKVYKNISLKDKLNNNPDSHAAICCDVMFYVAPEIDLLDINIVNDNSKIFEEDIIKGINLALENEANIINISLGLESCSQELYDICLKAYNKGIPIIAASGEIDKIVYPAALDCVFKVSSLKMKNAICVKGKDIFINEKLLFLDGKYKNTPLLNSSFASAYATACFALLWESRPFADKNELLYSLSKTNNSSNYDDRFENKKIRAFIIEPNPINISDYSNLFRHNDISVYDIEDLKNDPEYFSNLNNENLNLIINPHDKICSRLPELSNEKFNYIGNFIKGESMKNQNVLTLDNHINYYGDGLSFVNAPIVAIGSFGCNQSKFELLLNLVSGFKTNKIDVSTITYNPLGILFGFNTFKYPKKIEFPNIVYNVNSTIAKISTNKDIVLVNLPGSMCSLNDKNNYDFGMLCQAYTKAVAIDIFIMCINPAITR